ncbi:unnamed protein product [Aphanomyces euteiches]
MKTSIVLLLAQALILTQAQDLDAQVQAIVDRMSVEELIGQMTQINIDYVMTGAKTVDTGAVQSLANQFVGSMLNTPINDGSNNPGFSVSQWRDTITQIQNIHAKAGRPIVYGLDSLHGANYVKDAVLFPQQVNIGATFNPTFAKSMGSTAGRDTKAAGIPWLFTPCLDVSRHKGWPRTYETFGEDPVVVSSMAKNAVEGIQGQGIAACFKHFMGYSASPTGKDRDPITLSTDEILNIFMPSFKAAIDAGVMTGMGSYIQLNGVPMSANRRLTIDLLRNDLKWDGMLVSDWAEMYLQYQPYGYASSNSDAVLRSMKDSSYDMCMVPTDTSFIDFLKDHYYSGRVSLDRIKTSAKRIVKLKLKLDLYNNPVPGADLVNQVGDISSQQAALAAARESLVLVKNTNNILPLNPESKKFFLTGSSIDSIGYLCGGWSLRWHGRSDTDIFPKYGRTIRGAAAAYINDGSRTMFYEGVDVDGVWADINLAKQYACRADYTIVAIGERTYAEQSGNGDPWELPSGLTDYVRQLASTGTKIILVLVEGRPRLLNGIADLASAVIYAGLPCELGGEAIADVIFGKINPSGKMSSTYPKTNDQLNMATPYYGRRGENCVVNGIESSCPAEWQFGHGLSYTTFSYSNMQLSATELTPTNNQVTVSVTVANTGGMKGKESVLLFVKAPNGPETRLLKAFSKIELSPGQSTVVSFKLTSDDFGRYVNEIGEGLRKAADGGNYFVSFKASTECSAGTLGDLCKSFTWTPPKDQPSSRGYFNLVLDGYGLALSNTKDDALAYITPSSSDSRQDWYYSQSFKQFKNRGSGLCLDAYEPKNGGAVHTYACDSTNANQRWNYDSTTKQLRHATHVGYCFDKAAPYEPAPHLWECLPTSNPDFKNQQITLVGVSAVSSGTYNVVVDGFGLAPSNTRDDVLAFVAKAPGDILQDWVYDPSSKQVKNRGSGLCLDAWQPVNGGGIHTFACDSGNVNQRWQYDLSTKQLRHLTHVGYCLDLGASTGDSPHVWQCLSASNPDVKNQVMSFTVAVDNTIEMPGFNLVLTAADDTALQFQGSKNLLTQKWRFDPSTQMIRSIGTNKCLDAWEAKNDGGVHIWECSTANANQRWRYNSNTKQLEHVTLSGYCLDIGYPSGEKPHMWACLPTGHPDFKNQQIVVN